MSTVPLVPSVAVGAQEGLRERQQRGEGKAATSEGYAKSGVQGESTVSGPPLQTFVPIQ